MTEQRKQAPGEQLILRAGGLPVEATETGAPSTEITPERVLQELRSIAFADIRRIVQWDGEKLAMTPSDEMLDTDAAAIAEIVAQASSRKVYRVKCHDKAPALLLLARCLGMLDRPTEDEPTADEVEEAREFVVRELDRIAAKTGSG